MHFENAIYRVLHEQSNITGSFAEHLEVHENLSYPHALWINSDKSNKTTRIRDNLHFENAIYRVLLTFRNALWMNSANSN